MSGYHVALVLIVLIVALVIAVLRPGSDLRIWHKESGLHFRRAPSRSRKRSKLPRWKVGGSDGRSNSG